VSAQEQLGLQFDPITTHELPDLSSAHASREVSPSDFQQIAQRGHERLERMGAEIHDIHPLTNNLTAASQAAYKATREPWGGQTINPRSGQAVDFHYPDKFAMAARDPGQEPITMRSSVNYQQFREHMGEAAQKFSGNLQRGQHYLGVFHDSDKHTVEIDPSVVVGDPRNHHRQEVGQQHAEEIMAARHSLGGAYHFASGNGLFPPHVSTSALEQKK
jgi:hypothetical protein